MASLEQSRSDNLDLLPHCAFPPSSDRADNRARGRPSSFSFHNLRLQSLRVRSTVKRGKHKVNELVLPGYHQTHSEVSMNVAPRSDAHLSTFVLASESKP